MCYIGKCARATPRPALRPLAGSGRGARVKSAKLGSPPRDFPRSWTCSSRELTVRGSVDSPVGEIPWFLCASAEKLHAQGPLPVKEIAIYYDRWEGEGLLCSLQDTERDFPSFFFPHRHLALGFVACVRTTGYVRVGSSRLSSRLGFVFGRIPGGGSKCAIAAFVRFLPTRNFSSLKPTLKS